MEEAVKNGVSWRLFGEMPEGGTLVVMPGDHGEGEAVYARCRALGCGEFALVCLEGMDWNRELSPWAAPAAFRRGESFAGGGADFLRQLTEDILPPLCERLRPGRVVIAGYSLAGLFALWAAVTSGDFDAAVSASGSLWFPGLLDWLNEKSLPARLGAVYLSLGDAESKTKNPVMACVEDNTRAAHALLRERGIRTTFALNPGGHFVDDEERLSKGIAWALRESAQ